MNKSCKEVHGQRERERERERERVIGFALTSTHTLRHIQHRGTDTTESDKIKPTVAA